ncbi:hypothetical protein HYV30_02935 [Candidatus Kaiserbacteria bacterium]|nr:hypothetical protein [Candidatus Kaiserbacteria bacterium]
MKYSLLAILLILIFGVAAFLYRGKLPSPFLETSGPDSFRIVPTAESWLGTYTFYEFAEPNRAWTYDLSVKQEGSAIVADLDIDGFQTIIRIRAKPVINANGDLDLIFDSYRPEHSLTRYAIGDLLFTLSKLDTAGKYSVRWGKLKANIKASHYEFAGPLK